MPLIEQEALKPVTANPRSKAEVVLPDLSEDFIGVKLGMHTDTLGSLLRFLNGLQWEGITAILIEGRVITPSQWQSLKVHPVYRFYISSRFDRRGDAIVVPNNIEINEAEVNALARSPFTPQSLSDVVGFATGFFDVSDILRVWGGSINSSNFLLPQLGGCNQFFIGSPLLGRLELEALSRRITRHLNEQEISSQVNLLGGNLSYNWSIINIIPIIPKKNNHNKYPCTKDSLNFINGSSARLPSMTPLEKVDILPKISVSGNPYVDSYLTIIRTGRGDFLL